MRMGTTGPGAQRHQLQAYVLSARAGAIIIERRLRTMSWEAAWVAPASRFPPAQTQRCPDGVLADFTGIEHLGRSSRKRTARCPSEIDAFWAMMRAESGVGLKEVDRKSHGHALIGMAHMVEGRFDEALLGRRKCPATSP